MSCHFKCVEYTTHFIYCDHDVVSVQPCRYHDCSSSKEASTDNMCNPIRLRITTFRFCTRCRQANPYMDEFGTILHVERPNKFTADNYSFAWLQSISTFLLPEMPTELDEYGWNPQNDSKATRRSIGVLELENLEVQLQTELLENPIPEQPTSAAEVHPQSISRQKAARKRPSRLPTELATARPMILTYSKPELVEINYRHGIDEPIRPSAPRELPTFPPAIYKPYRRPSNTVLLLDTPKTNVPAVTLTPPEDNMF